MNHRTGTGLGVAEERIYPPYKIATLVQSAGEEGLGAPALLAGCDLAVAQLEDPETRTSVAQFVRACGNAIELGASAGLAFRMGARMRTSSYGLYGFALLTSRTAREGMQFAQRFHRLATPTFRLSLRESGGLAAWTFHDLLGLDRGGPLYRFLVEFQLALQTSLARDIWDGGIRPTQISVSYPRPAHHALYAEHLGVAARFDQAFDGASFDAALLDAPMTLHNPLTANMVMRMCERLLEQASAGTGMARQVYRLLAQNPGRFPDMQAVARALNTTSRTLRRRLADEGTSFQEVLNEVRANLAKEYLRNTRMSSDDIAGALGFSDAANFRQAFRKWTRQTPGEFRRASAP